MEFTGANYWFNLIGIKLQHVSASGSGWTNRIVRSIFRLLGRSEWRLASVSELSDQVKRTCTPPVIVATEISIIAARYQVLIGTSHLNREFRCGLF